MIHPFDKIKLPAVIERVLEYIDKNTEDYYDYYERSRQAVDYLYELSPAILKCKFEVSDSDLTPELGYFSMPFEIVPFSYNGGNALNYSWANLTPELGHTNYHCVSYAPLDDWAVLLGNSPEEGLYNLMIGCLRGWEASDWMRKNTPFPTETNQWKELVKLIGPFKDSKINITAGARSKKMLDPVVPNGWKYHSSKDGIGILAPEKYFSADFKPLPPRTAYDTYSEEAHRYLKKGKAATAIVILKQAKEVMILYNQAQIVSIVNQFKAAYEMLNREAHFNRAEVWLSRNTK